MCYNVLLPGLLREVMGHLDQHRTILMVHFQVASQGWDYLLQNSVWFIESYCEHVNSVATSF